MLAASENDLVVPKPTEPITFIVIVFMSSGVLVKSGDLPALLEFLIRASMSHAWVVDSSHTAVMIRSFKRGATIRR